MQNRETVKRWLLAVFAGIILSFFGLYPQLRLWHERGENWHGAYAYNDLDEVAYAAYLQALIDERPRRNDPYTGRDHSAENPQPESLFSIQFWTPFLLAKTAQFFDLSASSIFTYLAPVAAFFAALTLFWLIVAITNDSLFAFTGTLVTLCCGVLINGEGAIGAIFQDLVGYPYFPFLRRYVPAVPFPFFFLFCLSIWQLVSAEKNKVRWLLFAVFCFAFQVYSYFYLWTTAAAFLACLFPSIYFFKPDNRRQNLKTLFALGILCVLTLIPYAFLLANRAATTDHVQLLVYTRMPDVLRPPLILSLIVLSLLAYGAWKKRISPKSSEFVFTFSLALVCVAVFNQQIFTGRSLQPIHYQVFIGNYVAIATFALAVFFVFLQQKSILNSRRLLSVAAVFAIFWGLAESYFNAWFLDVENVARDEAKFLGDKLTELGKTELFDENGNRRVTMNFNWLQGDDQPTVAPQAVLWTRHLHVFAGATWEENKERLYQFYYYNGVDEFNLEKQLREKHPVTIITFFGWGRHASRLTKNYQPISNEEIEKEVQTYAAFIRNFNLASARRNKLSYIIVDSNYPANLTNLDRWYERDAGEQIGRFVLYRVKLKQSE